MSRGPPGRCFCAHASDSTSERVRPAAFGARRNGVALCQPNPPVCCERKGGGRLVLVWAGGTGPEPKRPNKNISYAANSEVTERRLDSVDL